MRQSHGFSQRDDVAAIDWAAAGSLHGDEVIASDHRDGDIEVDHHRSIAELAVGRCTRWSGVGRRIAAASSEMSQLIDCLIAAHAVDAGMELLQDDADFDVLARCTALRLDPSRNH